MSIITSINTWFKCWWTKIPEPREISLIWGVAYSVIFFTGLSVMLDPPRTIIGAIDSRLAITNMCLLMMFGAVFSSISGYKEYWRGERWGLFFMAAPTFVYGLITFMLHQTQDGNRIWGLGYVTISLLFFLLRYFMIRGYTRRPGSHSSTGEVDLGA